MALTVYDIALNLKPTMDLSDGEPVANNDDDGWSLNTSSSSEGEDDMADLNDIPKDDPVDGPEGEHDDPPHEVKSSPNITIDSDSEVGGPFDRSVEILN